MKKFISLYYLDILIIALNTILLLFIIKKMPYAIIGAILNLSLSILCLYFLYKKEDDYNKIISAKEFFSSLLSNLNKTFSLERSYQLASKYLISYHEIKSYDEILEEKSFAYLNEYEPFYKELIDKELHNEIHLSNYHFLINKIDNEITKSRKFNSIVNKIIYILFSLVSLIFFVLVFLRFTLYTNTNYGDNFILNLISLLFSLIIPSLYLAKYYLKGERNV